MKVMPEYKSYHIMPLFKLISMLTHPPMGVRHVIKAVLILFKDKEETLFSIKKF